MSKANEIEEIQYGAKQNDLKNEINEVIEKGFVDVKGKGKESLVDVKEKGKEPLVDEEMKRNFHAFVQTAYEKRKLQKDLEDIENDSCDFSSEQDKNLNDLNVEDAEVKIVYGDKQVKLKKEFEEALKKEGFEAGKGFPLNNKKPLVDDKEKRDFCEYLETTYDKYKKKGVKRGREE